MEETSTITTFRPADPKSLAQAVAALDAEGADYRVVKRNEGGMKQPKTVYYVHVRSQDPDFANRVMEGIASEIILPKEDTPEVPLTTLQRWQPVIFVLVLLLIFLIVRLLA